MSRTSPTGWVDPVPVEDWTAWAAWGEALRRREAQHDSEIARALAKAATPRGVQTYDSPLPSDLPTAPQTSLRWERATW